MHITYLPTAWVGTSWDRGCQVNKFEQVSSDGFRMLLERGGLGLRSSSVSCPGGMELKGAVQWGSMHHD